MFVARVSVFSENSKPLEKVCYANHESCPQQWRVLNIDVKWLISLGVLRP